MNAWYSILNADAIPSPALLLYPDRIRENLRRLISLVGDVNRLRPHVKTHKLPQVISMKKEFGITKFKVSTIAEAEMTAAAGGDDILLAIQPVGPNVDRLIHLIHQFPAVRFSSIVDDAACIQAISRAADSNRVSIPLWLDLNVGMNRTGITLGDAAFEMYRLIDTLPGISTAGLHAYDGHLYDRDLEQLQHKMEQAFAPVWEFRRQLELQGLHVPTVVAGGTPTSRFLAQIPNVEVGTGTTVLWDFGQQETSPDLEFMFAAVLIARVVSHPGPNRLCIDLGHKAVASEMVHPRVRFFGLEDAVTVMHSEEHLVIESTQASAYPVGSVLYGIPRHICPTVALHQHVWCVDNQVAVEVWPVIARNRMITI